MARPAYLSIAPTATESPGITRDDADRCAPGGVGPRAPVWKVHDRTHIECGIDWALGSDEASELEWDAYFFVPESLRLDRRTYSKQDIYSDLRAYVRLAVPEAGLSELAGAPLAALARILLEGDPGRAVYEMRFFASCVRAASARARKDILPRLDGSDDVARAAAFADVAKLVEDSAHLVQGLREVLRRAGELPDPAPAAARWVDEDISRMIETLGGELAVALQRAPAPRAVRQAAEELAAREARHRRDAGLSGVAWAGIDKNDIEHLEFRRHVLKRFTASVLWLTPKLEDPSRWAVHLLYALAAGVAMAFAVIAALWNGLEADTGGLFVWGTIAVLAYMAKDRMKAFLQQVFSKVVSKRYPDRRWVVHEADGDRVLGRVDERVDFVRFERLPKDVLAVRRATREHPLEEQARPETVLWHRKDVTLHSDAIVQTDPRVHAMREILRLDLRRWLAHTDDPKRRIVFADPETGEVCSAMAPRVYNIGIVYRLRRNGDPTAPWHRVRVVVTRKGIRRIDPIS